MNNEAQKYCKLLNSGQLKVVEIYQAEGCPEQSLTGLPQASSENEPLVSGVSNNLSPLKLFSFLALPRVQTTIQTGHTIEEDTRETIIDKNEQRSKNIQEEKLFQTFRRVQ